MVLNLIFLGPPGAGKGIVSQALMGKHGLVQLSTGDLIRAEVERGSKLGKEMKKTINGGNLVSDSIVGKIFESELKKVIAKKGFEGVVFDGFPRTLNQAEMLNSILSKLNQKLTAVIYIDSSKENVVKRLSSRWICPKCKKVYNSISFPPKNEGVCDIEGAKLEQRDDDKAETIAKRFDVYMKQTSPLIDYYSKKGLVKSYDGNVSAEESISRADKIIISLMK